MKSYQSIVVEEHHEFKRIELVYSFWHHVGGNPVWFCRIWKKREDMYSGEYPSGESYGRNKFKAYRLAVKEVNKRRTIEEQILIHRNESSPTVTS